MTVIRAFLRLVVYFLGFAILAALALAFYLNMRLPSIPPLLPLTIDELTETYGEPDLQSTSGMQRWRADVKVGQFVLMEKNILVMLDGAEATGDAPQQVSAIFRPTWTALEVLYLNGVGEQRRSWGVLCMFDGLWPSHCETWG